GELDIGGGGAILIMAGDCPHIHVYSFIIYYFICQVLIYNSHAYAILAYQLKAVLKINNLAPKLC
ncbi:MAG: hypothetical protein QHH14_14805, partial [Clostridiales bacterium]|nr:hypothetical protein [Clostridiales bacterium]